MTAFRTALAVLALVPWLAAGCDTITASLLRPVLPPTSDTTPPVFTSPQPAPGVAVVSAQAFTIQVTDPSDGGLPGSGVNPARIEANVIGGGSRPVTVLLPNVTVHLAGLADGPVQIAVQAVDFAGNTSIHVFTTIVDRTPPTISFNPPPPASLDTASGTLAVNISVRIDPEPNFEAGSLEIRLPGADGTCGTADDSPVPPAVVANPSRVLVGPGTHAFQFILNNPVPPLGQTQAILYCWIATARDAATGLDGSPGANTSRAVGSTLVTWRPRPL